jgi:hypothetical protein
MNEYESNKRKTQICPIKNIDDVLRTEQIFNLQLAQLYAFKRHLEEIEQRRNNRIKTNTISQQSQSASRGRRR